ncbi:MAG: hypothetical protein KUG81_07680, partial [Gammaproteobacteria bacterium]|nr:hypothetical protein [Gammaproteobacteria bacterium]
FKLSDKNKNKKLSSEEMVNTGMMLVYMAGLADGETVKLEHVYDNIDEGYRIVPIAVNALIEKYDLDKSDDLSQAEFTSFDLDTAHAPLIKKMQDAVKSMGQIFPSFLRFSSAD